MNLGSRLAAARALVLENFGYKFASLAISVTLFMVFRGAGAVQRSVDVPITAVLPAAYAGNSVLITPLPERVRLTVRGTPSVVAPLRGDEMGPVQLDLRDGRRRRVYLDRSLVNLPAGVDFVGFTPQSIDLRWDALVTRPLAVRASVVGNTAPRSHIAAVTVEPERVQARGPSLALEARDVVHTVAVDASGLSPGRYERRVPLEAPRDGIDYSMAQVRVTFEVEPLIGERRFERLPVTVRGLARGAPRLEARPPVVAVVVTGDPELLSELLPSQIVPVATAPDTTPIRVATEVRVQTVTLREGLTAVVEPPQVLLVPTREP
ncbi:MAG: YbbR-like domain-containing protein [Myxococcaceae bacterium]|nr:MAG: YbbR-like domain-containing protein [Myxococcaceae bacterium]